MRVLSIGSRETVLPDDASVEREQFERLHVLGFQNVLEPAFLARVQTICRESTFVSDATTPGHREVEEPQRAGVALRLALSRSPFLRWLEAATGCEPLREVVGMLAQTLPRPGDGLAWHDDISRKPDEHRVLALVIHLSEAAYEGGEFELRQTRNPNTGARPGPMLLRTKYTDTGSMTIFRVSRSLEHRVLPITAGGPRRVFAGWALARSANPFSVEQ